MIVDDSLMMHIVHICCLHDDLHKDKEKYKAWVHNFIIWWWTTHLFYAAVIMPSKMHKVHMVQLWRRIPWLSRGWGLLLLMVSRNLDKWLWAHGLLVAISLMDIQYVGYMDDYLSCILINIVGWPRKSCYHRHSHLKTWIFGDMVYSVT